jgi:hypothetical protein
MSVGFCRLYSNGSLVSPLVNISSCSVSILLWMSFILSVISCMSKELSGASSSNCVPLVYLDTSPMPNFPYYEFSRNLREIEAFGWWFLWYEFPSWFKEPL